MTLRTVVLDFLFSRLSVDPSDVCKLVVKPVAEEMTSLRSRGIHHLDQLIAARCYDDSETLRQAIAALKYRRDTRFTEPLAKMLVASIRDVPSEVVLCPVPLHVFRRVHRGFNQSLLLARVVSREIDQPVHCLLRRTRSTGHQVHRTRRERLAALEGAFCFYGNTVPKHVVLVDDLSTTGATLDACAKTLKEAGVHRVDALVIARA